MEGEEASYAYYNCTKASTQTKVSLFYTDSLCEAPVGEMAADSDC